MSYRQKSGFESQAGYRVSYSASWVYQAPTPTNFNIFLRPKNDDSFHIPTYFPFVIALPFDAIRCVLFSRKFKHFSHTST